MAKVEEKKDTRVKLLRGVILEQKVCQPGQIVKVTERVARMLRNTGKGEILHGAASETEKEAKPGKAEKSDK